MNVGVDTPLDRRASSGTNSCPGNRVRFILAVASELLHLRAGRPQQAYLPQHENVFGLRRTRARQANVPGGAREEQWKPGISKRRF